MSKERRRVPKLRFPGFTEDWEQRKFLDLLDAQNGIRRGPFGSSLKKDSFVKKSDYVVYEQQNAIYDNYETRYFISKEKYNELIRFNIQPGDFIMSGAGTIGRISMVPDGIKKGVFNQALIRFKVNKDSINSLYFLKFMQSDMMQKQLTQANPGSAMTNLVPMDELKKWDVTIPSLEEQNRISTFINQIDAFITLHQRKLDNLKLKKKALLQKLFPKNGERYPELRFPGFTDAWEQREFSDIFAEVKSGLSRMLSNDDIGLPVVRANNINDGQLNLVDDIKYWYKNDPQGANTNNYLIEQGNILINFINSEAKMGTAAYVTRRPERDTIYTTNILRCKVNDEYNPYFIYSLTFLNSYKNYIASITKPAVNQASFTTVDFKKYSIKIPTVKEQNQIADLIETFNKLITLHQRKLDHLQLQKKALLQQMFV